MNSEQLVPTFHSPRSPTFSPFGEGRLHDHTNAIYTSPDLSLAIPGEVNARTLLHSWEWLVYEPFRHLSFFAIIE